MVGFKEGWWWWCLSVVIAVGVGFGWSKEVAIMLNAHFQLRSLLYLHLNNGLEVTNSEVSFIHQLKSLQLKVPPLIAHYLTGFGNTTIPNGREAKFRMQKVPAYCNASNTTGWFGSVSPDTQPFYQNYPCLAVFVARMFASLEGYGPREKLSHDQRILLEHNGVLVGEQFPSFNQALPININLLTAIHTELRAQSGLQLLPLPETVIGTVGQICFTVIEGEHKEGTTRATPITSMSLWNIPWEVSSFATAITYRVHHAVDEAAQEELPRQPWVVWRFGENAPADWAQLTAAGNSFRESEPKILTFKGFTTAPYQIRSKLEALETSLNGKIS
ncbi:hypothetical protein TSUD_391660 [Trifolium subterraneum]|uniref:Uncharacterized protein n=1 Tax=Trifolium subterraneum TaxID=3900 RepID=A0A2Z6P492_TRISU|nr:hypothetical protein TSUD_391660 [Trifolium subterraneum]